MTVRELLGWKGDIDVYDDVCEELGIAFCGPMKMTEEGEKVWSDVLDYEVELYLANIIPYALVHVDDVDGVWEKKLERAKEFFESLAGYCPADDYDRWFVEVEE